MMSKALRETKTVINKYRREYPYTDTISAGDAELLAVRIVEHLHNLEILEQAEEAETNE